jgi:erythromycin esterase
MKRRAAQFSLAFSFASLLLFPMARLTRATVLVQPDNAAFVSWGKEHAVSINGDLAPLKSAIGNARVVALGENSHLVHELLQFRNRLFEFLVQQMGFTAIALETGFSESVPVNDFVLGGAGNPRALAHNVFCWVPPAPAALGENLDLIEWMRAYNQKPSTGHKVRLYGIDLTGGSLGALVNSRAALDEPLAYLDQADPDAAKQLRNRLEPFLGQFTDAGHKTMTASARDSLTSSIADLVALFERRRIDFASVTSEAKFATAYHAAVVARQLDADFRSATGQQGPTRDELMTRDAAMAENLKWVLEREGPAGRVLLFAHRGHVQKSPGDAPGRAQPYPPMGEYLRSAMGDSMVMLGFTFGEAQGDFGRLKFAPVDPRSLDGLLASVGRPAFALDLRARPKSGAVEAVLNSPMKSRWNDQYEVVTPAEAYDVLLFLDRVSPAHRFLP